MEAFCRLRHPGHMHWVFYDQFWHVRWLRESHRGRPMDNFISPAAKIEKTLVWMKDYRYQVQYKGLHQICGTYDCYTTISRKSARKVLKHQLYKLTLAMTKLPPQTRWSWTRTTEKGTPQSNVEAHNEFKKQYLSWCSYE